MPLKIISIALSPAKAAFDIATGGGVSSDDAGSKPQTPGQKRNDGVEIKPGQKCPPSIRHGGKRT